MIGSPNSALRSVSTAVFLLPLLYLHDYEYDNLSDINQDHIVNVVDIVEMVNQIL